ncbi:MAG: hypothetical protein FJY54_06855 [Betaproteobacteria bacterium]|nr:hypothetical protein [Betaproteobacteria bacterium]
MTRPAGGAVSATTPARYQAAAWLLVAVAALAVAATVFPAYPGWLTGIIGWIAVLLLWPRLPGAQARVVLALVTAGLAGVIWGAAGGVAGLYTRALAQNIPLIAMLIAVSFLRLINTGPGVAGEQLSTGRGALLKTMIGVHLFGAVINFSAVAIFADRLSARAKLTLEQATGLSRAFMVGALWSPFFGAMAVTLTVAPEASLARLMATGIPLSALGIAVTWVVLSSARYNHARDFVGYPLHLEALWVPAVLAIGVLVVHEVQRAWSVLAIITVLAPLLTVATLLVREGNRTGRSLLRLVRLRLPEMCGEVSLFLAAGVLSAGMAGAIVALDLRVPFERFGGLEASIVLLAGNLVAWLGVHPVILISVVGPWLATLDPDPTLLAMTFLMTWGIGLTACPMSNTLVAINARYHVSFADLVRRNRTFSVVMTLPGLAVLNGYALFAGR